MRILPYGSLSPVKTEFIHGTLGMIEQCLYEHITEAVKPLHTYVCFNTVTNGWGDIQGTVEFHICSDPDCWSKSPRYSCGGGMPVKLVKMDENIHIFDGNAKFSGDGDFLESGYKWLGGTRVPMADPLLIDKILEHVWAVSKRHNISAEPDPVDQNFILSSFVHAPYIPNIGNSNV